MRDAPRSLGTPLDGVRRFAWLDIEEYLDAVTPYELMEARGMVTKEAAPTGFQIWGIPSGAQRVLEKMAAGDFLMLLESTDFRYVGQVLHRFTQPNHRLSRHIWGEERFPLIILLQGEMITYGWDAFAKHFSFDPKYHMRGNTMSLSSDRVSASQTGTEERFISTILTTTGTHYGDQEIDFRAFANNLEVHLRQVKDRANQQAFRSAVLAKQGRCCAVCGIDFPEVLEAAHLIPKEHNGSDDYRNGLPLCALHHRMFDAAMFRINPGDLVISPSTAYTLQSLRIERANIHHLQTKPHKFSLEWRWKHNRGGATEVE